MIATIPPRGHHAEATVTLRPRRAACTSTSARAEFGNGTATVHVQIVAEELGVDPSRVRLRASDTDARRLRHRRLRLDRLGGRRAAPSADAAAARCAAQLDARWRRRR